MAAGADSASGPPGQRPPPRRHLRMSPVARRVSLGAGAPLIAQEQDFAPTLDVQRIDGRDGRGATAKALQPTVRKHNVAWARRSTSFQSVGGDQRSTT